MKKPASFSAIVLTLLLISGFFFSPKVESESNANQNFQTRPIQLGTTGANINDISSSFCCSGTLGALVKDSSGNQFILSNNHVLAKTNKGIIGEGIIQPGLVDQTPTCFQNTGDTVANLSAFKKIKFKSGTTNTIDAAIAQVVSGAVDPNGSILDIGQVSSSIVAPAVGMDVKKSGRTTGLTTGTIKSINLTVSITYDKRCGIGSRTALFTNQIGISPGSFSAAGDSGSLIVENAATCPRAVGLLFAGSSSITIANPIGNVLNALGVSMVGCSGSTSQAASPLQGLSLDSPIIASASQVKSRHEQTIMSIPGVVGVGVGLSQKARTQGVIQVYVKKSIDEIIRNLPNQIEGIPVEIIETGEIFAF